MSDSRLKNYALTAGSAAALAATGLAGADIQKSSGSTAIPVSDSSSLTLFTVGVLRSRRATKRPEAGPSAVQHRQPST